MSRQFVIRGHATCTIHLLVRAEEAFFLMPEDDGTQETSAEKLCQMLEWQLAYERAGWRRAKFRRRTIRAASFLFLLLLVIGTLVGSFLIFSRAGDQHSNRPRSNSFADR